MTMRFILTTAIVLASSISPMALAADLTIDFNGIAGSNGSPFTSYTQSGFTVSPSSGSWLEDSNFGNPAPYIYFIAPGGSTMTSGITIADGGTQFAFRSIDLYSSTTSIPYSLTGLLNGAMVFSASGTVPNTFGSFAQVNNPYSTALIDTLEVNVTNPAAPCCSNPVGLDNIALITASTSTPEPGALPLLLIGFSLSSAFVLADASRNRSRRQEAIEAPKPK